ncbi:hypothetical protein FOZ63_000862 [Perkinsus olseni]|uniref:Lactation elevated protein 1 n=1 Tax=Perkinsus olseni TaxID=32597 RepID=A0A7J6NDS2_PEROL|nr:hypothetical protein FOZ63_000862 [Perkinsus olseni]
MLLDTFYNSILEDSDLTLRHKRQHFFDFMREIHERMQNVARDRSPDLTPVEIVANTIADETDLLCLDEVAVVDVQDASILPRVLEILSLRGVTLVMTSNSRPNELFAGGLNRHVFIPPLLRALEQTCIVDYRRVSGTLGKWAGSRYYYPASSPSVAAKFDGDFERIEGETFQGPWIFDLPHSTTRTLRGGQYKLANSRLRGVIVDFNSLCGKEYGEADFSTLADHFKLNNTVLFIRDVLRFVCSWRGDELCSGSGFRPA